MDWKDISTLLSRTAAFFDAHTQTRKVVADTLSQILNTPVSAGSLSVKGRIVNLKAHPLIKNELLLKQEVVLKSLKEKGVDVVKVC